MSSGKDDLFGKILGSAGQGDDSDPSTMSSGSPHDKPETDGQTGLNPLDLLGLPPAQRDLINWLSRRKQAQFDEIREALALDPVQLTEVLSALKAARHVQEALINGKIFYRVVFAGKVSRAARGLPESIWERVDLDNTVFLRQIPLFQGLPDGTLRDIADTLEERPYRRNEVILWQGDVGEGIYFIKSGIVGITRLSPDQHETEISTYLNQGDLLGEYRLLFEQNITASATATALSEVEVLVMKREDVLSLLKDHPSAAIELVQMLAQRLLAAKTQANDKTRPMAALSLVLGIAPGVGCTTVGSALALKLAQVTQSSVVYTEHPTPQRLPDQFGFAPEAELYTHSSGYNIFVPRGLSGVPAAVRATLVMDRLMSNYTHSVVGVTGPIDETVNYMLERASQVVMVVSSEPEVWSQFKAMSKLLKLAIRPERTSLYVVYNRANQNFAHVDPPEPALIAFDLPWFGTLPAFGQRSPASLPSPLAKMVTTLANRLGRTNQIGIYIPTRLHNKPDVDMSAYVQRTLGFLEQMFGSATGYPVTREADSDPAGVTGERIQLVQTFVTQADMDRHLGSVLAFVERIKSDLDQEAMALEVNQNVMLV
jgi:CRP/FNR family transcriptional regulator